MSLTYPRLRPFWRYYGGKYRAAPHYPPPKHDIIIEPFAGAAGYSTRYHDRYVILVEKYPVVAEVWKFLIGASYDDVMAIPLVEHISELPKDMLDGARHLVGFSFNDACTTPSNSLSVGRKKLAMMGRKFEGWNAARREFIARQVEFIKHWIVIEGSYEIMPTQCKATWFVDPPYNNAAGRYYKNSNLNYLALGQWCKSLSGQVIACENVGADWLPFLEFRSFKSSFSRSGSKEAIWYNEGEAK